MFDPKKVDLLKYKKRLYSFLNEISNGLPLQITDPAALVGLGHIGGSYMPPLIKSLLSAIYN